jgi:hypothetical protein
MIGGVLCTVVSFCVYGVGHFWSVMDPIGFSLRGACGGIITLLVCLVPILLVVLAILIKKRIKPRYEMCLSFLLCIVIGAILYEMKRLDYDVRYAKSILDKNNIKVFWDY